MIELTLQCGQSGLGAGVVYACAGTAVPGVLGPWGQEQTVLASAAWPCCGNGADEGDCGVGRPPMPRFILYIILYLKM